MIKKEIDLFKELKDIVREEGLLERVPVRGTIEMIAIIVSLLFVLFTINYWNPFLLGLFLSLIFTRSVFVVHDLLHTQYFKSKSFSKKISYLFSSVILGLSPSWWDWKHNVNHHTWCNVPERDEDILVFDGVFVPDLKGKSNFKRKNKYILFWGALAFMYPAFFYRSYKFVLNRKLYMELGFMLSHWIVIWGTLAYLLPFSSLLITFVTLYFTLSLWLSFGFITNHFGCEVFSEEEAKKLSWMELQMKTSRSLSGGKVIHWFYGGLNTQIEHHLFPKAPRFNLLRVKEITQEFSKKHNIDYFETSPFTSYRQVNAELKNY